MSELHGFFNVEKSPVKKRHLLALKKEAMRQSEHSDQNAVTDNKHNMSELHGFLNIDRSPVKKRHLLALKKEPMRRSEHSDQNAVICCLCKKRVSICHFDGREKSALLSLFLDDPNVEFPKIFQILFCISVKSRIIYCSNHKHQITRKTIID